MTKHELNNLFHIGMEHQVDKLIEGLGGNDERYKQESSERRLNSLREVLIAYIDTSKDPKYDISITISVEDQRKLVYILNT